ncbi:MAG: hypothetical protein K2N51_16425 [Lachnospiraceae bacterium]|nr:hypothetical protein [Lachnospiraceae bacterium]
MFKSKTKNFFKKVAVGAGVVGVLVSTNVMAAKASGMVSTPFTKAKVDSNEYTTVAKVTKKVNYEYAYVTIDNIYKADGSDSKYKRIKGRINYYQGGKWHKSGAEKTITKGDETIFEISEAGRNAGTILRFRAMGNDPSLDCKVSGHFDTY